MHTPTVQPYSPSLPEPLRRAARALCRGAVLPRLRPRVCELVG